MTTISRKVTRALVLPLDGTFCADNGKPLAIRLVPGTQSLPDMLELWPKGTRRIERVALVDVYRYAIRCRVNRDTLEKARQRKARKAERLAAQRLARAERKLFKR
jgi:hypothetical protein